jgi:hypothetical protein
MPHELVRRMRRPSTKVQKTERRRNLQQQMPRTKQPRRTQPGEIKTMVWSYKSVKKLREKFRDGKEISVQERRKLEKYIKMKKQNVEKKLGPMVHDEEKKRILRAEKLLHDIEKQKAEAAAEVTEP